MELLKNLFRRNAKRSSGFMTNFNQVSNDKWNPMLRPPDAYVRDNHEKLVARCRDIADNDSYGAGIVSTFQDNVVTDKGITIQNLSDNQDFAQAIDSKWSIFCDSKMSTLSEVDNLIGLQKQAVSSFLSDGEVFIRKHYTPMGFKVEMIDPARIPYSLLTRTKGTQKYRNGILVEASTGKVIGYRVNDVGNDNYRLGNAVNERNGTLVSADEIIHVKMTKRTGQMRGTPLLKAVAGRIFKISQYENAVLDNATSSAKKYGFFTWDKDSEAPPDIDLKFSPSKSESGSFHELPAGISVDTYHSPFPDDELGGFTRAILLSTARALGISYPSLSGDLSNVNYASIRQACLAERAMWTAFRVFIFTELVYPIYCAYFTDEVASGNIRVGNRTLSLSDMTEIENVATASVQYSEIDPRNENIVETSRLQNLVISPSDAIRKLGGDPEQTWTQIGKDIKAMTDAGIPQEYVSDLFLRSPHAITALQDAGVLPMNDE